MKRFAILAVVVVGIVVVVAAAIPRVVSTDFVKQRIAEEITRVTGRSVTLEGSPSLSVYPHLAITIDNVAIADPPEMGGDAFVSIASLTSRVRLTPLFLGRIEFDGFDLVKPRIRLMVGENGQVNWRMRRGGGPASADGDDVTRLGTAIGRVTITDGTLIYDSIAGNRREEIADLDLEATWPTDSDAVNALGTMQWRGETVEFNGQVVRPAEIAAGRSSTLRFAIASTPLRISFDGTVASLDGQYQLDGEAQLTTPSLRRAIGWMGTPMGTGSILGAASISGIVNWFGSTVSFADARIELDGNSAVGGLAADFGSRTTLQGTLAAAKLDLSPYLEAMRANVIADGPWPAAPTGLPMAGALDADLRVATDQIVVGALRTGKAVAAASVKNGRVTVNFSEAQFYGGTLTARLTAAMNGDLLTASAQASVAAVPARVALIDLVAIPAVDGTGTATVTLGSRGRSWGEFVQGIAGTAEFSVADGSLNGIDVAELAAMALDPLAEPVGLAEGETGFASLAGTVSIGGGALETEDLVIAGDDFRIGVSGWGSVVSGQVEGQATLAVGNDLVGDIPLLIAGTWREPQFAIDRQRLRPSPDDATSGGAGAPRTDDQPAPRGPG